MEITPSLENYIEVLFELNQQDAQVRVTDLARRLSIAKSSVNQAVAQLVKLGLALHERYGRVQLTEKGAAYAEELERRHRILQTFFADVLGVDPAVANRDACLIEHVISPATIGKLTEYLRAQAELPQEPAPKDGAEVLRLVTLNRLLPGTRARVVRVTATGSLRRRILDMGLTPGSEVAVKKSAPLGDPIEVTVRGYALALRRSEANGVVVEPAGAAPGEDSGPEKG